MSPSNPPSIPTTFALCPIAAALVTALMTAFSAGASPPPVDMPILFLSFVLDFGFQDLALKYCEYKGKSI
jgi:hypothetical protein